MNAHVWHNHYVLGRERKTYHEITLKCSYFVSLFYPNIAFLWDLGFAGL